MTECVFRVDYVAGTMDRIYDLLQDRKIMYACMHDTSSIYPYAEFIHTHIDDEEKIILTLTYNAHFYQMHEIHVEYFTEYMPREVEVVVTFR